ncbi:hypothetical protein NEPAR04_1139 [Nematocida parisii]|nr:hypothetical protein NEPAR08_0917 [Nematocida parisii]KAI5127822.1 hypothetical protein NEPAR03_1102 [Nematocida parisii]KAI5141662.1 hypothetical protein NEPAR04_1139 [Nematocida parisii]
MALQHILLKGIITIIGIGYLFKIYKVINNLPEEMDSIEESGNTKDSEQIDNKKIVKDSAVILDKKDEKTKYKKSGVKNSTAEKKPINKKTYANLTTKITNKKDKKLDLLEDTKEKSVQVKKDGKKKANLAKSNKHTHNTPSDLSNPEQNLQPTAVPLKKITEPETSLKSPNSSIRPPWK